MNIQEVHEMVDNAVLNLVLKYPTYAQFLVRIGYKYKNVGNAVACTDGKTVYINDELIAEINNDPIKTNVKTNKQVDCTITKDHMVFVLCHELMHLLTLTVDRGEKLGIPRKIMTGDIVNESKAQLWNMATDYAINSLLVNNMEGIYTKPIGKMVEGALYDQKYINKTAEEIYEDLKAKAKEVVISLGKSGLPFDLDKHLEIDDDLTLSDLKQKIIETFGGVNNGTSDSSIDRFIKDSMKPLPFDWKKALTRYIRSWIKENYTWNKPSRAGIANGLILPSYGKSPCIHLAVAVDTSGSISDEELQAMLNHVATILSIFNNFTVDVWCCGSVVYKDSFKTYTKQNKNDIHKFKIMSDGGNDMRKNFEFIEKNYKGSKPDAFVCLTDGFDPVDGDTELTCSCPVIWLIIDHPQFTPPLKMKNIVYPYVVDKKKNGFC